MLKQITRGLAVAAVFLTVAACQDLEVVNTNDPDRFRAQSDPALLEALIASGWDDYYGDITGTGGGITLFSVYATESEYTSDAGAVTSEAAEPRQAHANLISIASVIGAHGPRTHYGNMLEHWSLADDLLRGAYDPVDNPEGLIIDTDGDQTQRARAMGKIIQGLALGQLANMYEEAVAIRSTDPFPESEEDALEYILPSDEVLEVAIEQLEDAIQILTDNPTISFPGPTDQWFGTPTPVGPTELIPFINTMIAHIIIMNARNPAERAAVDWDRVLDYTDVGLTALGADFAIDLDFVGSSFVSILQRTNSPFAMDNRLMGQADITGAYETWISQGLDDRVAFLIDSPDRRMVGEGVWDVLISSDPEEYEEDVQERGAYTRRTDNCCGGGGGYRESSYQWRRHAHQVMGEFDGIGNTNGNEGVWPAATVDQNNLYAAEAHFHMGDLPTARDLVNITRTREQMAGVNGTMTAGLDGLIAATVDGAPHDGAIGPDSCVPRTDAGECGDLHVVLRYERMVELIGLDITRGLFDSRAFGLMPENSWTELPIPAPELEQLGFDVELPEYAFAGGAEDATAAEYAPVGSGWDGVP